MPPDDHPRPGSPAPRHPEGGAPAGAPIDPEQIAALLDGRLGGPQRADVLARLAAGGDFQLFAETAAVLRQAEDEPPPGPSG